MNLPLNDRDIARECRRLWPLLAPCFRSRAAKPARGRPREYEDRTVFEAFLILLYTNRPFRKPLGEGYPSPTPFHRLVTRWIDNGVLQKAWRVYLRRVRDDTRNAWRRVMLDPPPATGQGIRSPKHVSARRNQYWYVVLRNDLGQAKRRSGPSPRRNRTK